MSLMFLLSKISFSALMSLMFFLSKNLNRSPYVPYVLLSKNSIRSPYVSYVSFYLKFSIFAFNNLILLIWQITKQSPAFQCM